MAMNADVKREWTDALRSGEYQKARGYLRTNEGYCCLGVLCEVAVRHGIIAEATHSGPDNCYARYGPDQDISTLPAEVVRFAELDNVNPVVEAPDGFVNNIGELKDRASLAEINDAEIDDQDYGFDVIADLIDAQL